MNMLLLALQASLCLLVKAGPAVPIFDLHVAKPNPSIEIPIEIRNLLPKIVGGVDAIENEFPFMVRLAVQWTPAPESITVCGASIINSDFILTAAHCVYNKTARVWAKPGTVAMYLGKHDMDVFSANFDQVVVGVNIYSNNYNAGKKINDIVIVRVYPKIKMNSKVQPICLASGTNTYADLTASIMGWGVNKYGFLNDGVEATWANYLQKMNMHILSDATCVKLVDPKNLEGVTLGTPDKVCIYDTDDASKGPCQGDSGGPLVVKEKGRYVQVGIASFVSGPCGTQAVTVYARVTYFKKFIQQTVGAGNYQTC